MQAACQLTALKRSFTSVNEKWLISFYSQTEQTYNKTTTSRLRSFRERLLDRKKQLSVHGA